MKNKRGSARAKKFLEDIGFDEITDLDMGLVVSGIGATLIEEPISNSDGTIVRGKTKTLIKVNSEIPYPERKRFTIAHEIGHYFLHEKLDVHGENSNTLNWFNNAEHQLQKGIQEWEANDFAAELLMPKELFIKEATGKKFNPDLLKYLSERFKTSITSTVFRYAELDLHPIFVVFMSKGVVKFWDKSNGLWVKVKEITKLSPPSDSVADEYIEANYEFVYSGKDKQQTIDKSTWFELKDDEEDSTFYEYCIPTKNYKTLISVVWED